MDLGTSAAGNHVATVTHKTPTSEANSILGGGGKHSVKCRLQAAVLCAVLYSTDNNTGAV